MSSDTRSSTLWFPNHAEMLRASIPVSSPARRSTRGRAHLRRRPARVDEHRKRLDDVDHQRRNTVVAAAPSWNRSASMRRAARPGRVSRPRRDRSMASAAEERMPRSSSADCCTMAGGAAERVEQRPELVDAFDRDRHAEVGDAGHDENRPRLVGAVDDGGEIGEHPRPVEVTVDRDDLVRVDVDGCAVQRCHERARSLRVTADELDDRGVGERSQFDIVGRDGACCLWS